MKQIISLFSFFCAINIFATDHYEDTNLSQGNGSTVFTESNQVSNDGTFQNTETRTEIYLTLSNQTASREAKIYFIDNTTTGFDNGYDGEMFGGVANDFAIYTHLVSNSQGKDYAIQSLPTNNYKNMIIPVGINAISGTTITIDASTNNFPTEMNIYLEDKQDNSFTLLDAESDFTTTLGSDLNGIGRFYLHTTQSTPTVFTPITDANFETAINTCLTTNPVDGMCSDSEYGAMPTWDVSTVTDMSNAFKDKTEFNADLSAWDVSNVTTMYRMFYKATSFNADLSSWDVSTVTTMSNMFYKAASFNGDLSAWNVNNVANMSRMFNYSSLSTENYDNLLIGWSQLTLQQGVEFGAADTNYCNGVDARQRIINSFGWTITDGILTTECELTITNANIQTAINACLSIDPVNGLCSESKYGGSMPTWDVSRVTDMSYAFQGKTEFNADLSAWDVSKVTTMEGMFDNSGLSFENYDKLLIGWSQLTLQQGVEFGAADTNYCNGVDAKQRIINSFGWIIRDSGQSCPVITNDNFQTAINTCLTTNPADGLCISVYGAMPNWDVSRVTDMSNAFDYKSEFNADLSDWDVSSVTDMRFMFRGATAFNADLSDWDVSSVTNMRSMFYEATAFNADLSEWDVSNVRSMVMMFSNATAFNADLSDWDVSNVASMGLMFSNATAFNADLSDWDVSNVARMINMFSRATAFNADLSDWDVSKVTDMDNMFNNSGLSTENYDKLLQGWSQLTLQQGVQFGAAATNYCNGAAARQGIIDSFGWTISDNGEYCTINNWNGSVSNDWFDSNNWSLGIPNSDSDLMIINQENLPELTGTSVVNSLTINSDASVSLTGNNAALSINNDLENNGTMSMSSSSSLIVKGASTGDITYNRSFPSTNWHLVSSPVQGQQYDNSYVATNELASNGSNKAIASYVSSDNSWDYLQENETKTFDLGTGLSMKKASDAGDISFTGTINVSDAGVAVTLSDGNNLIGNPYPSYIPANMSSDDFNNILVVNEDSLLEKTLYFWDQSVNAGAGEYIEINQTSNAMFISPAQGFFVKHDNTKSSNTFTFNEAMQSHSNSGDTFLKGATRTEVNLTITDGASTNSTDIYYIEQTTPGFDNGYDSTLFYNGGTDFGIYTHLVADSVGDDYGIQSLPKNNYENMIVPVGVNAVSSSEIVISATAVNLPSEINIYLEDKNNNSFTLLDNTSTYTTTLSKDLNGIGRFYVHTTSGVLSTDDLISNNNFSIYTSSVDNLRILGVHTGVANVCMYDILGKEVLRYSFEGNSVNDIALPNLKKGVYVVQLSTETGIINKKISLQK